MREKKTRDYRVMNLTTGGYSIFLLRRHNGHNATYPHGGELLQLLVC